mmetsp:Transcript_7846/g.20088  ORF Transcript_7846/g.20088 Transcript_7846/m.20088 type:complete len:94 (-) Transcript_7846:94-375(-)
MESAQATTPEHTFGRASMRKRRYAQYPAGAREETRRQLRRAMLGTSASERLCERQHGHLVWTSERRSTGGSVAGAPRRTAEAARCRRRAWLNR